MPCPNHIRLQWIELRDNYILLNYMPCRCIKFTTSGSPNCSTHPSQSMAPIYLGLWPGPRTSPVVVASKMFVTAISTMARLALSQLWLFSSEIFEHWESLCLNLSFWFHISLLTFKDVNKIYLPLNFVKLILPTIYIRQKWTNDKHGA